MNLKNKKKKKNKTISVIIIITIFITISTLLFINYYSKKAIPILKSYAESEVRKLTILIINKSITKQVYNIDTEEIFKVVYNNKGEITLIDFDSKVSSKILSNMTSLVELNLRAVEEGKIDSNYHEWWGYEDSKLFTYAKEYLTKISKDSKPFNFTMLTADTHFTDGYLDKSCDTIFSEAYANSFSCSDSMIAEFISWIQEQDFYENTTIVLTGDHPTMQENFYNIDNNYDRVVYNAFINSRVLPVNNKNRVFTTMDMFPTTLAALGVSIEGDRLGLGTNLFSSKKTIPEEIGLDNFNKELKKSSDYYYKYIRK